MEYYENGFIDVETAAQRLGYSNTTQFYTVPKMQQFLHRPEKGYGNKFDIRGWLSLENEKAFLVSRTELLIQYILYEVGIKGSQLARDAAMPRQKLIRDHSAIGVGTAIKFMDYIKKEKPEIVADFMKYYSFNKADDLEISKNLRTTYEDK